MVLQTRPLPYKLMLCIARGWLISMFWWAQVAPPADPDKAAAWASHESLLLRMEVKDQAVARELAGLGLPLSMHPGDNPDPPFDTPFSGVVYFLAKLTRGCASWHLAKPTLS